MILGIGDGIGIGSVAAAIAAVWIKALSIKRTGNGYVKTGEFNQCVKRLEDHMDSLEGSVSEVRKDVREILSLHLRPVK